MEFPKAYSFVPTEISSLTITLRKELVYNGIQPAYAKSVRYLVEIQDQNGRVMSFPNDRGDLVPILTPEQITALDQFVEGLWAKAQAEFL